MFDKKGKLVSSVSFPVKLKIESLRKTVGDEMQAHVAIHEAGHAVASIYGAKMLPEEILSRTANVSEGYCSVDLPPIDTKELFEKYIIICLGGYVAEKMIFGEENLGAGTYSDFESASSVALSMAKQFGMLGDYPMLFGHRNNQTNTYHNAEGVDETEELAKKLIKECEKKCTDLLQKDKYLFLMY